MLNKILITLLFATPLLAQEIPLDPNIRIGQTESGVTYYLCKHRDPDCSTEEELNDLASSCNRAQLMLVVPVGSVLEEEHEQGVAHMVEHVLFRGTENFSEAEINDYLDRIGADIGPDANAFTSFDETVYQLEVPVEPTSLMFGLQLLCDWATCATLTDEAIEAERGIVLEEWRMGLGARSEMTERVMGAFLWGSPYANRLPIGKPEIIEYAPTSTIREFYKKWYPKAPVAIIAVGDFDIDAVEDFLIEAFADEPKRLTMADIPIFDIPQFDGMPRCIHDTHQHLYRGEVSLAFTFPAQRVETLEDLRTLIVREMLEDCFDNRMEELIERGAVPLYDAYFDVDTFIRPCNICEVQATCDPAKVPEAMDALATELRRVQEHGFTDTEMERERIDLLHALSAVITYYDVEESEEIAYKCLDHFLHGTPLFNAELVALVKEMLPTVTAEEIADFARQFHLGNSGLVSALSAPQRNRKALSHIAQEALASHTEPFVDELVDGALPLPPPPGKIVAERTIEELGLMALTLENGMRVCLKSMDQGDGYILLNGMALQGESDISDQLDVELDLARRMLNHTGYGGYTQTELSKILVGQDVDLSLYIADQYRRIRGYAHQDDISTLMQLVHLAFAEPSYNEALFERVRTKQLEKAYSDTKRNALEEASFEVVSGLAAEAFQNPADFALVFVGQFDLQKMKKLVAACLANIPYCGEGVRTFTPASADYEEGVKTFTVHSETDNKGSVYIGFPIKMEQNSPLELRKIELGEAIIDQRVHQLVREKLSGAYASLVWADIYLPDIAHGTLGITFQCDPEDAELLSQMVLRELRILKKRGPTEAEVRKAITKTQRRTAKERAQPEYWTEELGMFKKMDWRLDKLLTLDERVKSLSKKSIHETIGALLPLDNHMVLICLPEGFEN